MSDIFKWVSETFTQPKMQRKPHVMDAGSYSFDPIDEAAQQVMQVPEIDPSKYSSGIPAGNSMMSDPSGQSRHNWIVPAGTTTPYEQVSEERLMEMPLESTARGEMMALPGEVPPIEADGLGMTPMDSDMYAAMGEAAADDPNSLLPPPMDPSGVPNVADYRGIVPNEDGRGVKELIPMESGGVANDGTPTPTDNDPLPGLTDPVTETDPTITQEEAADIVTQTTNVGTTEGITPETAQKVAAEDPAGFKKAVSWFADTMGLQDKDLYRMAILYAGSRVAGYDHSGSMSWAFETGMKSVAAREVMVQQLSDSGKYTPKSVEEFKRTGDRSKLKLTTSPNPVKTDFTKPMLDGSGKKYYKRQDKAGNVWYESTDGKRHDGSGLKSPQDPESRIEIINEHSDVALEIVEGTMKATGMSQTEKGVYTNKNWGIVPATAAADAVEQIVDMMPNMNNSDDLNTAMVRNIIQNATEAAARDAASGKFGRVGSIKPYVVAQMQYFTDTGTANEGWKQALMRNGEKLSVDEWFDVRNMVIGGLQDDPRWDAAVEASGEKGAVDAAFTIMYRKFLEETPEEKQKDGNAFFGWLQNRPKG